MLRLKFRYAYKLQKQSLDVDTARPQTDQHTTYKLHLICGRRSIRKHVITWIFRQVTDSEYCSKHFSSQSANSLQLFTWQHTVIYLHGVKYTTHREGRYCEREGQKRQRGKKRCRAVETERLNERKRSFLTYFRI